MAYIEAERRVNQLKAENAKLREELAKARDPQRIGGQADPSSFAYAIEQLMEFRWQHATNDEDAIPYINNVAAAHERENAGLRELVEEDSEQLDKWQKKAEYYSQLSQLAESDNTKLRELVRDMWDWLAPIAVGGGVPMKGLHSRMRDLGVVDA